MLRPDLVFEMYTARGGVQGGVDVGRKDGGVGGRREPRCAAEAEALLYR